MIEDFSKYKLFYVNGSSFTEGGGLEEESISKKSVSLQYKKQHNVIWENRKEVNWGNRLSKIIKIKCINESKSGAGVERLVRKTYEFIFNNWDIKDKFFIILELPSPDRIELFLNKANDYYILNLQNKNTNFISSTRDYFTEEYKKFDEEHHNIMQKYMNNHFSYEEKVLSDDRLTIGLYSFCKLNKIKVYLDRTTHFYFQNTIDKNDLLFKDVYNWCIDKNLTIANEISGSDPLSNKHPGFFGHIEYAKELAKFLGWNSDIDIFKETYVLKSQNLI